VRPSIHPKPSKVMESEIRENHQVFRRVHILLVPHVLTKVSSFSRHIKNPARREVQAKLRRLIQTTTEIPIESIYGAEREEFEELGLTDAVLLHFCTLESAGIRCTLLTADANLALRAESLGYGCDLLWRPALLAVR